MGPHSDFILPGLKVELHCQFKETGHTDLQSNTSVLGQFKALPPVIMLPSCAPNWKEKLWESRFLSIRNFDVEREVLLWGWTDAVSISENPCAKTLTHFYPRATPLWFFTFQAAVSFFRNCFYTSIIPFNTLEVFIHWYKNSHPKSSAQCASGQGGWFWQRIPKTRVHCQCQHGKVFTLLDCWSSVLAKNPWYAISYHCVLKNRNQVCKPEIKCANQKREIQLTVAQPKYTTGLPSPQLWWTHLLPTLWLKMTLEQDFTNILWSIFWLIPVSFLNL